MPDPFVSWALLAAIPVLLVIGGLSALHWSRYIGTLTRLHRSRSGPQAALAPSTVAWLELRGEQQYRRAYRRTWELAGVLALGLAVALAAG